MSYLALSALIVAFAQPAWLWWLGPIAATVGYALCWRALVDIPGPARRFWAAVAWYCAVQLVQMSWLWSHPYSYAYLVHASLAFLMACQYGLLALLLTNKRARRVSAPFLLAGVWTLMEWSRLFFLAGWSFNPAGLALAALLSTAQVAALFGVFGLTFWVILTNALALRALLTGGRPRAIIACAVAALLPYLYGTIRLAAGHEGSEESLSVVLVDTTFPPEELLARAPSDFVVMAKREWRAILRALVPYRERGVSLIVLPEGAVPLGVQQPFYRHKEVIRTVEDLFGETATQFVPDPGYPYATEVVTSRGDRQTFVSNGFWVQTIMALFEADVLIGSQGEQMEGGRMRATNAALMYRYGMTAGRWGYGDAYAKRVLLLLAEALPGPWLRPIAARYGIADGFAPGLRAGVIPCRHALLGVSVCYEETFPHIMRENRTEGAQLLVNISNDVWYPRSKLARQHYDLGRLRSIELGLPALRCCNYGISGGIDCKGRQLATVDGSIRSDWSVEAVPMEVSLDDCETLYSRWGDQAILLLSALCVTFLFSRGTEQKDRCE